MNRFKVINGSEAAFESVWLSRDSHLDKVPGFVELHLLKGPEAEDHTLHASRTAWKNRATDFHRLDRTSLRLAHLLDHFVCAGEQRRRHGEAERLRGRQIDDEVELGRLLDRDVGWLRSAQNLVDI